jgi:hypothetical protein
MDPSPFSLWPTDRNQHQQQAAQEQWVTDLANIPVQTSQYHSPQPASVPDPVAANHIAPAYRKSLCDEQASSLPAMNKS